MKTKADRLSENNALWETTMCILAKCPHYEEPKVINYIVEINTERQKILNDKEM